MLLSSAVAEGASSFFSSAFFLQRRFPFSSPASLSCWLSTLAFPVLLGFRFDRLGALRLEGGSAGFGLILLPAGDAHSCGCDCEEWDDGARCAAAGALVFAPMSS